MMLDGYDTKDERKNISLRKKNVAWSNMVTSCNVFLQRLRYENLEIIGRKAVYSGYVDDSGRRDNSTCTVEVLEDGFRVFIG